MARIVPLRIGGLIARILPVLAVSLLSACVTYRVQSSPNSNFDDVVHGIASMDERNRRLSVEERQIIARTFQGAQAEAVFCSEPVLSVLTLGIVPRICVGAYRATLSPSVNAGNNKLVRDFETKTVSGWLALLLLPFPDWKYGHENDWGDTIRLQILDGSRSDREGQN